MFHQLGFTQSLHCLSPFTPLSFLSNIRLSWNVIIPLFYELLLCVLSWPPFLHRVLRSAFSKADHAPRLDHFFCLFFQQLIQPSRLRDGSSAPPSDVSGTLFLDGLPAVRWLTLPSEIKVHFCVWEGWDKNIIYRSNLVLEQYLIPQQ